ncbi:MAG: hypothetical protein HY328_18200 [Chloroflexi bacterium]|nr:hypothetical protein [Chloroflexota bacterium]
MRSFSDLLNLYTERTGISDAELARAVGVRRQTIFRWKEGTVARPRSREDVLAVGKKLRLSTAETDELLIAAGFYPEGDVAHTSETTASAEGSAAESPLRARLPDAFPPPDDEPRRPPSAEAGLSRTRLLGLGLSALLLLALIASLWLIPRTPLPVAVPGETLVIVGQFTNFTGGEIGFNVAGRIADPLRQEIEAAKLAGVRVAVWPQPIRSEAEAQAVLSRSVAWMVIWGEYDSGRVLARFAQGDAATPPPALESLVASPGDLFATINSGLPQEIRYLALLTLGAFYADNGDYAQARAVLIRANATPPQERDARAALLFRLGLVHQLGDDPQAEKAIAYYSELLALAPDHLLARYNRGLVYLERQGAGDWERALGDFDSTIQRSPGFLAARIGRGVAYLYRRGEGDEAAATRDFTYVIERDDQRTMAFYNRGLLAIRQARRELWESDLQRTIELAPEFANGYSALCWGYVLDEEAQAALPVCDRAIGLGAQEALHSRGMAHIQQASFALATDDLAAFLVWLDQQPAHSPYLVLRAQVEEWLSAVQRGENPLTAEILYALRRE